MKFIEHRRHSMRKKPFAHLSQQGVDLAKKVGTTMALFDYVVTSTLPRAAETAVAMGYGVDEVRDELSSMAEDILDDISWDAGFEKFFIAVNQELRVKRYATRLREMVLELLKNVPDGGRLLMVSHGGIVEASLVGCVSDSSVREFGPNISYCEGVSFVWDGKTFVEPKILRV